MLAQICLAHGWILWEGIQVRFLRLLSTVWIGLLATQCSLAQEHNFPTLNTVGRFFGVGWSHGYHSKTIDGRYEIHKQNHPANMYPSRALQYPYDPNYAAAQVNYAPAHQPCAYGQVPSGLQPGMNSSNVVRQPSGKTPVPNAPQVPAVPPKPIEPPPAWLRPYLNEDGKRGELQNEQSLNEQREEVAPREPSPSDKAKDKDDDDLLLPQSNLTPTERYHQAFQHPISKR
jgi:hypothetical protein